MKNEDNKNVIIISQLDPNAKIPQRGTPFSAGYDLYSVETVLIHPKERRLVSTGLSVALPSNMEMQIRPRSGNAFNMGLTVLNSPGTIDPDYRGEVKVLLINLGEVPIKLDAGSKIAQAVFSTFEEVKFYEGEVDANSTERGIGGFGSTGLH